MTIGKLIAAIIKHITDAIVLIGGDYPCCFGDEDIAIELVPDLDDCDGQTVWVRNSDQWSKELNEVIPYEVDAQWNYGEEADVIHNGLSEACMLVYEK